jgi:hypothetical protein
MEGHDESNNNTSMDRNLLMTEFIKFDERFIADMDLVTIWIDSLPSTVTEYRILTSDCYEVYKRDYDAYLQGTRSRVSYVYHRENTERKLHLHPGKLIVTRHEIAGYQILYLEPNEGFQDILDCSDYKEVNFVIVFPF